MQSKFLATDIQAVDLFCGAGGLSYGLKKAGIEVVAGLDMDPKCAYPFTQNLNAHFLEQDLAETDASQLQSFYSNDKLSLLAGCAPCQPFSTLSNGSDRQKSKKWPLLKEFNRMAYKLRPDLITMENVPILRTQSIFDEFVKSLKDLSYYVTHQILDAADYGVPQRRKRLVLLASRFGPVRIISPEELGVQPVTVRDAISHLPPIEAGQHDDPDTLHRSASLTPINLARMKASSPGGTWEDWPEQLRLKCHQRESGSTYKSVYGRLDWDKPSSTMTTQSYNFGTGRFGHPEQNRSLSLREMAILQSFPPDYQFVPPKSSPEFRSIGRLIGNAVPVQLGYVIGMSLSQHVSTIKSDSRVQ